MNAFIIGERAKERDREREKKMCFSHESIIQKDNWKCVYFWYGCLSCFAMCKPCSFISVCIRYMIARYGEILASQRKHDGNFVALLQYIIYARTLLTLLFPSSVFVRRTIYRFQPMQHNENIELCVTIYTSLWIALFAQLQFHENNLISSSNFLEFIFRCFGFRRFIFHTLINEGAHHNIPKQLQTHTHLLWFAYYSCLWLILLSPLSLSASLSPFATNFYVNTSHSSFSKWITNFVLFVCCRLKPNR